MEQYIDKSSVIAEIEKRRSEWNYGSSIEAKYKKEECDDILSSLNTIEVKEVDYENKYKNALERAKKAKNNASLSKGTLRVLEIIFPELKESEDEKIRKGLIENFKWFCGDFPETTKWGKDDGMLVKDIITWLEKQESVGEIVERCKTSWYNEGKIVGMAEGLTDDEKYQQGWHDALEKQGEKPQDEDEIIPDKNEARDKDEKIRKELIEAIQGLWDNDALPMPLTTKRKDSWIAWLEKQESIDRDKLTKGVLIGVANSIIQWLDANVAEGNMCLSNMECLDIENCVINADWNKVYRYMKKELEKQDGKKSDNNKEKLDVLNFIRKETCCGLAEADNALLKLIKVLKEHPFPIMDKSYKLKIEWEEQQGEQNLANNVKSKFKVGDWVVGANNVCKIIALNDELNCYIAVTINNEEIKIPYYFDDGPGHMCSYHLWAIKDAKDGDVLTANGKPFIYCCNGDYQSNVTPATKEQRDTLFAKMKELGYELDAEKKKLIYHNKKGDEE